MDEIDQLRKDLDEIRDQVVVLTSRVVSTMDDSAKALLVARLAERKVSGYGRAIRDGLALMSADLTQPV